GPPPRISSGEMLCLMKSKPLRLRAAAKSPRNFNTLFIGPPDLARFEYADAVGAELGNIGFEKDKAKFVLRPPSQLLNVHLCQGLLPGLIGFLPQGFRFAVVAMVAEHDDIVLPE